MEHKCNLCIKQYKSYNVLWEHKKKFHKTIILPISNKKIICEKCEKIFNSRQAKSAHKKNVKLT